MPPNFTNDCGVKSRAFSKVRLTAQAERRGGCLPRPLQRVGRQTHYAHYRHPTGRGNSSHGDQRLPAGEAGDDGGEVVHIGLKDEIVGDVPALSARLEIFHQLVHRPDEHVGALQDLLGA
jgi:hypothetical protein